MMKLTLSWLIDPDPNIDGYDEAVRIGQEIQNFIKTLEEKSTTDTLVFFEFQDIRKNA